MLYYSLCEEGITISRYGVLRNGFPTSKLRDQNSLNFCQQSKYPHSVVYCFQALATIKGKNKILVIDQNQKR
jgi:hypothetical protein